MNAEQIALQLIDFYHTAFGGKELGRFRISVKNLRQIVGRKRLYPDDIAAISREVYQLGYVFIDMETFFVLLSQKTFTSYRRVNDLLLEKERSRS